MACLVWDSPGGRKVFRLDRAVMVVGRDPGSDVHVPDKTVSRRHALLQVDGDRVRITDLGSTSKTRINGAALVRDIPSTLEAGDVVHFGKLPLTFHAKTPPAAARRAPPKLEKTAAAAAAATAEPARAHPARERAGKRPKPRKPPKSQEPAGPPGTGPWKLVAIGLAFVVVALLGAFLALHGSEPESPVVLEVPPGPADQPTEQPKERPEEQPEKPPAERPESAPDAGPEPQPAPEHEPVVERAPADALPPTGYAPIEEFPDLLEVDGKDYYAVAVVSFDDSRVDARGRDGRVYTLARREVTRILDRADLVRRIAVQRADLAHDDVEARLQLARWCVARYVPTEARQLLDEVLKLQPDNEAARALREGLEGGR